MPRSAHLFDVPAWVVITAVRVEILHVDVEEGAAFELAVGLAVGVKPRHRFGHVAMQVKDA